MPGGSTRTQDPSTRGNARTVPAHTGGEYWRLSTRPLHILVFLLPMLVLYEVGAALCAPSRIAAESLMRELFEMFGASALFAPPIALVTILLVWHVLIRDRWRIHAHVLPGMLIESVAWALPLVVLSAALGKAMGSSAHTALHAGGLGFPALAAADLHDLPWQARLTVAVGAGLYEEMLFRLVGIAFLHFIIKDLLGAGEKRANILAVAGAALAFAMYHGLTQPGFTWTLDGLAHAVDWRLAIFTFVGGFYLGAVYVTRGFGIVVATHCLFDVVALFL